MSEQTMITNEQVALALGWTDIRDLSGRPGGGYNVWGTDPSGKLAQVPDYDLSVDADEPLLVWAAERGWAFILSAATGDGQSKVNVTFWHLDRAIHGVKVADTPTHALAGAICAAWLALVAKLQEAADA